LRQQRPRYAERRAGSTLSAQFMSKFRLQKTIKYEEIKFRNPKNSQDFVSVI